MIDDGVPARMTTVIDDQPTIVVGIPLRPMCRATYFEFVDLSEVNDTLDSVALSLFFGALITTMFGVVLGWFAANRAVRPLGEAAQAAKAIAGGRLDTRLEATDDLDLRMLANSFNDMASALQARVERDARFASDVSHELRSPLMTLAASVEVMQARRADMPERAQAALDLLVGDVARFQGLVEDLLEISRFDAGAIRLHREDLLVAEFVRQAVAVSSMPKSVVTVTERAERMVMQGDRRRLARVIANLIDNARLHGGGEPAVHVTEAEGEGEPLGHVWIAVEDHGPGVPLEERDLIFERFARGAVAGRRSSQRRRRPGSGAGRRARPPARRAGVGRGPHRRRAGARFVLELPAEEVGRVKPPARSSLCGPRRGAGRARAARSPATTRPRDIDAGALGADPAGRVERRAGCRRHRAHLPARARTSQASAPGCKPSPRDIDDDPDAVMAALLAGPNTTEFVERYRSNLPTEMTVLSVTLPVTRHRRIERRRRDRRIARGRADPRAGPDRVHADRRERSGRRDDHGRGRADSVAGRATASCRPTR